MTLMAEVTAIVNARPIALAPTDVVEPQPLLPSMLFTMKTRPESLFQQTCMPAVGGGEDNNSRTNSGYDGGGNTYKACSPEENGRHPDKT